MAPIPNGTTAPDYLPELLIDACEFKYNCRPSMRSDGHCDLECRNELCGWDERDCIDQQDLPLPSDLCYHRHGCHVNFRGNGRCDEECQFAICNFDEGDCAKVCTCEHGVGASDDRCTGRGDEMCIKCNAGYHLEITSCVVNACLCDNGVAAHSLECLENNRHACVSCSYGYHLLQDLCIPNECACQNGKGARGVDCGNEIEEKCVVCDDLYTLRSAKCELIYHVYSQALCFDRHHNYTPTVYDSSMKTVSDCRKSCDSDATCSAFASIPPYEPANRTREEEIEQISQFGKLLYDPGSELPHVSGCYIWRNSVHIQAMRAATSISAKQFRPVCAIKKAIVDVSYTVKVLVDPAAGVLLPNLVSAATAEGLTAIEPIKTEVALARLKVTHPNGTFAVQFFPQEEDTTTPRLLNTAEAGVDGFIVWNLEYTVALPNKLSMRFWANISRPGLEDSYRISMQDSNTIAAPYSVNEAVSSILLESEFGEQVSKIPAVFLLPGATCGISFTELGKTCLSSGNFPQSYDKGDHCVAVFIDERDMVAGDSFYTDEGDVLKYDEVYSEVRRPLFKQTSAGERVYWKSTEQVEVVPLVITESFTDSAWFSLIWVPVVYIVIALSPFGVWLAVPYKIRLDKATKRLQEKGVIFVNWYLIETEVPLFACYDDMNTCLYAFCCPAIRAAHTYEKADFTPFWYTFAWWTFCPIVGIMLAARNRLKLLALVRNMPPLFTKQQVLSEAVLMCFCFPCTVAQEARLVDEASQLAITCPLEFAHSIDHDDLLGQPLKVLDIKKMMPPRAMIRAKGEKAESNDISLGQSVASRSTIDRNTGRRIHLTGKRKFAAAANTVMAARAMQRFSEPQFAENNPGLSRRFSQILNSGPELDATANFDLTGKSSLDTDGKRKHEERPTIVIKTAEIGVQCGQDQLIRDFENMDIGGAGSINYREFLMFLNRKFGVNTTTAAMQRILVDVDKDMNGVIDRQEFLDFFTELDELVQFAREDKMMKKKKTGMKKWGVVVAIANGVLLIFSIVAMFQRCSLVCSADHSGKVYGCPKESRGTCWSQCLKIRSIDESVKNGMYSSIAALLSGIIFVITFIMSMGGPAIFVLVCKRRLKKPEETEIEWRTPAAEGDNGDAYNTDDYHKASRYLDRVDRVALTHSYFNPLNLSASRVGWDDPTELVVAQLGVTEEVETEEPVAWIAPDQADTYFVEKPPESVRNELLNEKKDWEDWTSKFNQRNYAKEVAAARPGPQLEVALNVAYQANIGGLEEHEIRLQEWKKEQKRERAEKAHRKQQMNEILEQALAKDTETAISEALSIVDVEWGGDKALLAGSRQYKFCTLRLQQMHFGSKPRDHKNDK